MEREGIISVGERVSFLLYGPKLERVRGGPGAMISGGKRGIWRLRGTVKNQGGDGVSNSQTKLPGRNLHF